MTDNIEVKLTQPSDEYVARTGNEIADPPAIFECMSGDNKGNTRVAYRLEDSARTTRPERFRMITLIFTEHFGNYRIRPDDYINYDWDKGVIDFSSDGVKYRIRAVQPTDTLHG